MPVCLVQALNVDSKLPALHMLHKLFARLATGRLRGSFTANGCIVSPAVSSKGRLMLIQSQDNPLPAPSGCEKMHRFC